MTSNTVQDETPCIGILFHEARSLLDHIARLATAIEGGRA